VQASHASLRLEQLGQETRHFDSDRDHGSATFSRAGRSAQRGRRLASRAPTPRFPLR
jgi:hypothetical protein